MFSIIIKSYVSFINWIINYFVLIFYESCVKYILYMKNVLHDFNVQRLNTLKFS